MSKDKITQLILSTEYMMDGKFSYQAHGKVKIEMNENIFVIVHILTPLIYSTHSH